MAVPGPAQFTVPPYPAALDPGRTLGRTYCIGEATLDQVSGLYERAYIWQGLYDIALQQVTIQRMDDPEGTRTIVFTGIGPISTFSFSLDLFMRPVITYKIGDTWYNCWFNPATSRQQHDTLPSIISACNVTDEFRQPGIWGTAADHLLIVMPNAVDVYFRRQVEEYLVDHYIGALSKAASSIHNVGMNRQMRLQIEIVPSGGVG